MQNLLKTAMVVLLFFIALSAPAELTNVQVGSVLGTKENLQSLDLPLLWTINTNTFLESSPTLADLNGDGTQEIVVAGREELIALDSAGKELWRWKAKGRFMTYPSVLTRAGAPALIYAGDFAGNFYCIDGTGKPVWEAKLDAPTDWSASVVADLAGLGKPCVVQTDVKGGVGAYDALTGKVIWKATVKGQPVSPAIGDVDGDGKREIVVATGKGNLALLGFDGTLRWEIPIGGTSPSWSTSAPIIFATASGVPRIAAATSGGDVLCLDAKGNILWRYAIKTPIASGLSAASTKDGVTGLYVATQGGQVYQFSETGEIRWNIDIQNRCLAAGALADIQGDGVLEYVLASQTGHFMVLDPAGKTLFEHQFDTRTINVTPACGILGGEMKIVVNGGEAGKVFCFGTSVKSDAMNAPWAQYRGDETKSGAFLAKSQTAQMKPVDLSAETLLAGEPICFDIFNPTPEAGQLKATAMRTGPAGETQIVTTRMVGKYTRLEMPFTLSQSGPVTFSWTLQKEDGSSVYHEKKEFGLIKLMANEMRLADNAVETLCTTADDIAKTLSGTATALRRDACLLKAEKEAMNALRERLVRQAVARGQSPDMFKLSQDDGATLAKLVAHAKRAIRISEIVRKAATFGPNTSLVAFEGTLWDNRKVEQQLPDRVDSALRIARRTVPGEHEPVAIGLLNITDRELLVRIPEEALPAGAAAANVAPAPALRLLRSVGVSTSLGDTSWDPMPEIDSSRTIAIPSFGMRELWIDADLTGIKPGTSVVKLWLQALNGAGVLDGPSNPQAVVAPETVVEIAYNILPFEMASSSTCRLCCWASYTSANIKDLLAHGNNVFVCPIGEPQYDAQGAITGFNYEKQDKMLDDLKGHEVIALLNGIPGLKADKQTPQYAADMKRFIEDQVRHVTEKGFDKNHFAFYPVDEPGGGGWGPVNQVIEFGKVVKAVDPQLTVYIDGGGEKPMFEAMKPYVSIWTPGISQLPEKSAEMEIMRSVGQLWSYDCGYNYARPVGANLKNINIVAEYRLAAPFVFRYGATGLGFWSYNLGDDLWSRTELEYPLVYSSATGAAPVSSRRWEGVREGVEDYRILTALRNALNAQDKPICEEAKARIKHLLESSIPNHFDQSYEEMRIGLSSTAIDATNNDRKVNALRDEMLDCVELLAP